MSQEALEAEAQQAAASLMRGHRVVLVLVQDGSVSALAAMGSMLSSASVRRDVVNTLKAVILQLEGN